MSVFTTSELETALNVVRAAVKENFANVSVRKGTVVNELLVAIQAIGFAEINKRIEDLRATQSLKNVQASPELADASVVDAILSNIFINRKAGSLSRGLVKVLTTSDRSRGVPQGTTFATANGLSFVTETDLIAEVEVTSTASLPIFTDSAEALFYFLVPVVASDVGDQYSIPQDTQLTNASLGTDIVLTTSFNDFSQGKPQETTAELLERAEGAITVRDLVTSKSIRTVLSDQFPTIEDVSVMGYGDYEMKRDQFGGFGLGAGGKVNIYVRTSREPLTSVLTKVISGALTISLETVGLDIPFYRVKRVSPVDNPGIDLPFTLSRSMVPVPNNELLGRQEFARFTIYERALLTFSDAALAGKSVLLSLVRPPEVEDIQRYVLDDDNRVVAADLLVYGVIPCFVKLSFSFIRNQFSETVDTTAVKDALKSYINSLAPGSSLSISKLVDIVHNFDIIRVKLPTVSLRGEIERPDGTIESLTTDDALDIPNEFGQQLSQRTAAYFITSDDITISEIFG